MRAARDKISSGAFIAAPAAALWWIAFRYEYLPLRNGYVSSLFLLALAGLALEAARASLRPAPGSRAASAFAFTRCVILVTLVAGIGAAFLSRAVETGKDFASVLQNPYAVNIIEGGQALRAWLIGRGEAIYTGLNGYPCLVTIYEPLYYLAAGAASLLAPAPLFAARLVSASSFAAAILFAGLLLYRREKNAFLTALFCLYLWQFQGYMSFARYARVDMLAWALFFLSAWLLARGCEDSPRGDRMLLYAALAMALAAFTKQQIAPLALPCAVYAVFRRRRLSPAVFWYALPGLIFGAAALLVARLYFGEAFFFNTATLPGAVAADPNLNSTQNMVTRLWDFFNAQPLSILMYLAYAATSLAAREVRLLDFVMLIQLPMFLISLRWWGGDSNYFIGPIFMMAAGAAVFMKRLANFSRFGPFLACALVLFLVPSKMNVMYELEHFKDFKTPSLDDALAIRDIMSATKGRALVESESGYLALSSAADYFDAVEIANMSRYDLWRFAGSRLEKDILSVRFPAIINSSTFLLPEIHEAIDEGYFKEKTLGKTDIYRPRPPGPSMSLASLVPDGPAGASLENLGPVEGEDCYAPLDPSRPGLLTLAVSFPEVMDSVSLRFFPRINAESPDNAVTLSWSRDGKAFTELYRLQGDGASGWTPAWDIREEWRVAAGTKTVYFRITLTGKAQIWLDPVRPLRIWIVPQRSPLLGNSPDVG